MKLFTALLAAASFFITLPAAANTIVIDLEKYTLTYTDERIDAHHTYPIVGPRSGASTYSRRQFTVERIARRPPWISLAGAFIPGGHAANPMGEAIIAFLEEEGTRPCAIHGAARSGDLGRALSACCIRMLDEHVLELYELVTYETQIIIKD